MALGDAHDHHRDDAAHGAEAEQMDRRRADPARLGNLRQRNQQQLPDDGQVADVHDADVDPPQRQMRLPESETDQQQQGQRQGQRAGQPSRQEKAADQEQAEQLDRQVQLRPAQNLYLKDALHELRQRAFEHDQEGQPEERERHVAAGGEIAVQQQLLDDDERRQQDDEKDVVAIAVLRPIADQRP